MKREFKIGLFMAVALSILAVFIFIVGDMATLLQKPGYPLYLYFDSAAGLVDNTVVRMAGVKIGRVKSIGLKGTQAEVTLAISQKVKLPKGSKASLAALGVLGEKYIEILPSAATEFHQPGDALPVIGSVGLDRLGGELVAISNEIQETGRLLREILSDEDTRGGLRSTLKNLEQFTSDLKEMSANNKNPLQQTIQKTGETVTRFDDRFQELSQSLDELISLLKEVVEENRSQVKTNLDQIRELTERTEKSLSNLETALEKIRAGEGTLGRLINKPDLYEDAEDAIAEIRKTVDPISKTRINSGIFFEYFSSPRLMKSTLALTFWPSSSRFVTGEIVRDPWEEKFTYSLQGGIRQGGFSPRAGILESRIGIGLDYYFPGDRLKFALEGYDFNRDPRPHFRLWTRFSPAKAFFLLLGLDDFTLSEKRLFFFGLGFGL